MRIVHTSDWHLGKRLFEAALVDDQAHVLEQIFEMCRSERADALVVAGDIYDRAVPPAEAVALFSQFVQRFARDLRIPLVVISGNHDSPERLGFGAEVLDRGRVHIVSAFERRAVPVPVEAGRRRLLIYGLPYLDPEVARTHLGDDTLVDHDGAVRAALAAARADRVARRADEALLVAHLFAAGGAESPESERSLVVGGTAQVGRDALDGWTYVALGHLHAPQWVGGRHDIRYSGSILKYSFGEADQRKSVNLIEILCGTATVRELPLTPKRDLVRVSDSFDALLQDDRFRFAESAFVEATYTDEGYVLDAAARLRQRFPHLLGALPLRSARQAGDSPLIRGPARDASAVIADFWNYVEGEPIGEARLAAFAASLAERREAEECALAS